MLTFSFGMQMFRDVCVGWLKKNTSQFLELCRNKQTAKVLARHHKTFVFWHVTAFSTMDVLAVF